LLRMDAGGRVPVLRSGEQGIVRGESPRTATIELGTVVIDESQVDGRRCPEHLAARKRVVTRCSWCLPGSGDLDARSLDARWPSNARLPRLTRPSARRRISEAAGEYRRFDTGPIDQDRPQSGLPVMRRDRNRAEELALSSPLDQGGLRFVVHRSSTGGDRRRASTSVLRGARCRDCDRDCAGWPGVDHDDHCGSGSKRRTVSVQPEMLVPCTSTSTLVRCRRRRPPRLRG
jgi:hypothetical protein